MPSEKPQAMKPSPEMICDEGGVHKFIMNKPAGCCDYCSCIFCWPCYMICSCMMSDGAAFANPLMEQMCGSKPDSQEADPTCKKCGLTAREATDLSMARGSEVADGRRETGYFSNAMALPSASGAGPRESPSPGSAAPLRD